ncbi:MAG: hypothetical protein EOL97_16565 [Spirochaetia bacterium]|nr:hypothetical protein [Spirochaetia bacterium]
MREKHTCYFCNHTYKTEISKDKKSYDDCPNCGAYNPTITGMVHRTEPFTIKINGKDTTFTPCG